MGVAYSQRLTAALIRISCLSEHCGPFQNADCVPQTIATSLSCLPAGVGRFPPTPRKAPLPTARGG